MHNRDPPELVTEKWKITFNKRRRQICSSDEDVFLQWPILKLPSGYIYVRFWKKYLYENKF